LRVDYPQITESTMSYIDKHLHEIVYAIISAVVFAILVGLVAYFYQKRKDTRVKLKKYYEFTWKKSSSLKPEDLLGNRPFNEYYYGRTEDKKIKEILDSKKNLLIVAPPLGGKSRSAYQALKVMSERYDVIKVRCIDINREDFTLPRRLFSRKQGVILIDDFHRFIALQSSDCLFRVAIENNVIIMATCRSETEYKTAGNKMQSLNIELETIFGRENIVELPKVSESVGKEVARKAGIEWKDVEFDGNIGSLFMPLSEMRDRFKNKCDEIEKTILRVMKKLYITGVYQERNVFPIEWIKVLSGGEGLEGEEYEWNGWLDKLKEKEFIKLKDEAVEAEEVYLEDVITLVKVKSELDIFKEVSSAFNDIPEAVFRLSNRAFELGLIKLEKAAYMKIAIMACEGVLKVCTYENDKENYAATQNNLGNAYGTLAQVQDKPENCRKAIEAYREALKASTLDKLPIQYAMTQNNLGNAYGTLAQVEDKPENCRKAIEAFREALKVRTLDKLPIQYATTQNNLGAAYRTLAEVEDKPENCRKAIEAFREALRVSTLDKLPIQYAATQNNLGNAYQTLAQVQDKPENCRKAIEAFQEALKVRTLDKLPIQYATTQNNLGATYGTLAEVEDKPENCRKAIEAYREALKVRTLDKLPMDYAATQNNLGNAYQTLAKVEEKAENCCKAIEAFREALKVSTLEKLPIQYAATQNNLGAAYRTLAEVEDKPVNCRKAIEAFREALKVYTQKESPEVYSRVALNLQKAIDFCKGVS